MNDKKEYFAQPDKLQQYTALDHHETLAYIKRVLAGETLVQRVRLDHTRKCNLQCYYCISKMYEDNHHRLSEQIMPFDIIQELAGQLTRLQATTINFYGGGEPLLHPDFINILRLFAGNGLKIQLITNGTHFTDAIQAEILRLYTSVQFIRVSVHGISDRLFKKITGVSLLSKVKRDVADLCHALQQVETPPIFGLFIPMVEAFEQDELTAFMDYALQTGFDFIWFCEDFRFRSPAHNPQFRFPEQRNWVQEYASRYPNFSISYATPLDNSYTQRVCYQEITNMNLAYEPTQNRLLRVRCANFHPEGARELPHRQNYAVLMPSELYDHWREYLSNVLASPELDCSQKHCCISYRRNMQIHKKLYE